MARPQPKRVVLRRYLITIEGPKLRSIRPEEGKKTLEGFESTLGNVTRVLNERRKTYGVKMEVFDGVPVDRERPL